MEPTASSSKESKTDRESSSKTGRKDAAAPQQRSGKDAASVKKSGSDLQGPSAAQPVGQPPLTAKKSVSPVSSSSRVPASSSSHSAVGGSPAASEVVANIPQTEQRTPKKTILLLIVGVVAIGFMVIIIATVIFTRKGDKVPSHAPYRPKSPYSRTPRRTVWTKSTRSTPKLNMSSTSVWTKSTGNTTKLNMSSSTSVWTKSTGNTPKLNMSSSTSVSASSEITIKSNATMPSGDARFYEDDPKSNGTEHESNGAFEVNRTGAKFSGDSDLTTSSDAAGITEGQDAHALGATPSVEKNASVSSPTEISHVTSALNPEDGPMSSGTEHASDETDVASTTESKLSSDSDLVTSLDAAGSSESEDPGAHEETMSAVAEASDSSPTEILEPASALSPEDSAASPEETSTSS
ncbi:uncharacterized protein LOC144108326 [Amblyomma americanum]